MNTKAFLLLCSSLLISSQLLGQMAALDIIEKSDEKMRGTSNRSEMTMKIVRPEWSREIKMKGWSLGQEYSLILITSPARDKGTATLKRTREIWNWQPTIDRVVKLPPSMMMQSWMGSDFTNDDLVRESSIVNDYTHELIGDTVIAEREAHKIQLIPKEDAPVVWGEIHAYITKMDYIQLLIKYFDEEGYLINTMVLSDIRDIGGRTIPTVLEMIPADNPGRKTVIIYQDMAFDVPIKENFFSIQNMKRVR